MPQISFLVFISSAGDFLFCFCAVMLDCPYFVFLREISISSISVLTSCESLHQQYLISYFSRNQVDWDVGCRLRQVSKFIVILFFLYAGTKFLLLLLYQGGGQVPALPSSLAGQLVSNLGISLGQAAGSLAVQSIAITPALQEDDDLELEEQPLSDTTASAPASDDEIGSTAATDGSTLRTSPAEQGGGSGAGSESGGSAVDSISGRHIYVCTLVC